MAQNNVLTGYTSQFYELAHRPEIIKGQQYIQWTEAHQLAAQGMSPCALRLWQYLLTKYPGGVPQEIELEELRHEISVGRSKVYSVQSLKNAITQHLVPKGLLVVIKKFTAKIMRVVANHAGAIKPIENKFAFSQRNLRFNKKTCKIDTSNPDSAVLSYKDFQEATNKPAVAFQKVEEQEAIATPCTTVLADEEDTEQIEREMCRAEDSVRPLSQDPVEDDSAAERLELVENAAIPLNPTLEKTVLEYTLEEVQNAIALYKQVVKEHGRRESPGGWLTSCLRGKYWKNAALPEKDRYPQGFLEAYKRLIDAGVVLDHPANTLPCDGYKQPLVRVSSERSPSGYELIVWNNAVELLEKEQ